eukprot:CAMPEP_0174752256 /NCGR_PEP_ID=MMETSP1094-20130205/101650_1 /TAXON_ID=156173 /ORGANISM="Chrysochromulina brevifilum, Strain UTEX LB 985" /LENGTH=108 /DNA_ID=CAMNT_0015957875 /DNA_START=32 /DNA_END=358 /DNA_ORIENTATION=-
MRLVLPAANILIPRLPSIVGVTCAGAGGTAAWFHPTAALAAETATAQPAAPVDDSIVVGFALVLFVLIGALQLSLGDIVADEAQLPSSVNLINKSKQRRSSFIKGKKK